MHVYLHSLKERPGLMHTYVIESILDDNLKFLFRALFKTGILFCISHNGAKHSYWL